MSFSSQPSSSYKSEIQAVVIFDFEMSSLLIGEGSFAPDSLFFACFLKKDYIVSLTTSGPLFCFPLEDTFEVAKKTKALLKRILASSTIKLKLWQITRDVDFTSCIMHHITFLYIMNMSPNIPHQCNKHIGELHLHKDNTPFNDNILGTWGVSALQKNKQRNLLILLLLSRCPLYLFITVQSCMRV